MPFDRKAYRLVNTEQAKECSRKWYAEHRVYANKYSHDYRRRLKEKILAAYGGKCTCCGETTYEFLCIDHINGGGHKHRLSVGYSNTTIYNQAMKAGFPKDLFRILCWNCNSSMGIYKHCPHTTVGQFR